MKSFRLFGKIIGYAVLAVGLVILFISAKDLVTANTSYQGVYEKAKRSGALIRADDLRNRYGAKDADNAAPMVRKLHERFSKLPAEVRNRITKIGSLLKATPTESKRPLSPQDPTIAEVLAVAARESTLIEPWLTKNRCDLKYEYEHGGDLLLPELPTLKAYVRVFSLAGLILAQQGKPLAAARQFKIAHRLACYAGDTPILISGLVRSAGMRITCTGVLKALKDRPEDKALLQNIRAELGDITGRRVITSYVEGEMFMLNHFMEQIREGKDHGTQLSRKEQFLAQSLHTRALEYCILLRESLDKSAGDPELFSRLLSKQPQDENPLLTSQIVRDIYEPMVPTAVRQFVVESAYSELLMSAFDVLDARQKTGAWPKTLPVPRRDPLGSKMLRYEVRGERVRIWSIGQDYKDSRGCTKNEDKDSDDILVEL